jgi:hypothetical protein
MRGSNLAISAHCWESSLALFTFLLSIPVTSNCHIEKQVSHGE